MNHRRKNIFLSCVSFLFLVTGILFCFDSVRVVTFLYDHLNLSLDVHFRSIGFYYAGTWMIIVSVIIILYLLKLNNYLKQERFLFFSSGLIIIHYFFHLSAIAINYPIYDDQGALLDFLVKFQNANSFSEKVGLIFLPYNESIMAIPRMIVLGWFKVFGNINFRHLEIFNGILLVLLYLVFCYKHSKNIWIVILTTMIFQFQFYDDAFWSISGLCYYNALLFTSGCIYFLFKRGYRNNFLASIFALLATLTFGNGWILFPFAVLFLFRNKKFSLLLPWILSLIIAATVFYLQRNNFHALTEVNMNPFENILFVLVFLGGSMQFFYSPILPALTGIFVISSFAYILFRKNHLTSSIQFLLLGFIILSAIAASPLRSGLDPFGAYGMRVRYGIFSIMAIVLCVSLLAEAGAFRNKMIVVAGFAFTYNLLTGLFFYPESVIRKENIEIVIEGLKQNSYEIRYATISKNEVDQLFRVAIEKGIYKP